MDLVGKLKLNYVKKFNLIWIRKIFVVIFTTRLQTK